MKVPISWLKDYVDIEMTIEELAERLTLAGLDVGSIDYIGIPQGEPPEGINLPPSDHLVWDREKLVLGAITEVLPHPNADRLVLAMVDYGGDELEQCVTGAPNLFEYKGAGPLDPPLLSPFAHEGAEVFDGHADDGRRMVLKGRELRGIYNKSMVCSEKELGISDEHEGIMLLDWDEFGHLLPGTPFQDVLGDAVLDIDMLPNIARCYSVVGVAREVAALTGQELRLPPLDVVMDGAPIEGRVDIDIRESELNPRFTFALIEGVEMVDSPQWMQRRLRLCGQRPINNMVDCTNYVMLELGQPLHAFDYGVLTERANGAAPTIITRLAEPGEHLVTLDAQDHALDEWNILVTDTEGALGFGGIMGGLESEIWDPTTMSNPLEAADAEVSKGDELVKGISFADRPATSSVLLEAAAWNFINIRQSMQSQKMSTEAGMRFSRGVHPEMTWRGLFRCIELMRQTGGGTIADGWIDHYPLPAPVIEVDLPIGEVDRLLGFEIPKDEIIAILRGLEFEVTDDDGLLHVIVPDHRMDIGEGVAGQADLIEEIARIYGYDRIPITMIADMLPKQRANVDLDREEALRDALVRAGLTEIVTYRFTTPATEARLTPDGLPSSWPDVPYVELANPIAADKTVLRHTLLSTTLDIAAGNARHTDRQMLFEIGHVYLPVDGQMLPDEPARLSILLTGPRGVPQWQGAHDTSMMDFFDLKGVIESVLADLHIAGSISYEPVEHNSFHPGRVARLVINGRDAGLLGEVHPVVRQQCGFGLDLEWPVLAAELDLVALLVDVEIVREITPVPTHPATYQDIALVVDGDLPAAEVEAVIRSAGGDLLEDARLFDVYVGEPIPAGKKSLAYSLTYRAGDRTLKDKEVAQAHAKIVKAAEKRLGAELRG